MIRLPPRSTRTDTLCPYTSLFRASGLADDGRGPAAQPARPGDPDNQRMAAVSGEALLRAEPARRQARVGGDRRSEEHTSELQSLMRISYAVFCLINKKSHYACNA